MSPEGISRVPSHEDTPSIRTKKVEDLVAGDTVLLYGHDEPKIIVSIEGKNRADTETPVILHFTDGTSERVSDEVEVAPEDS